MNNRIVNVLLVIIILATIIYVSIPTEELTDEDMSALLTKKFDLYELSGSQVALGIYKGILVIAEFPCSDVCPMNTVKIIRYNIESSECHNTEGEVEELLTPISISEGLVPYCVPKIIYGKQT